MRMLLIALLTTLVIVECGVAQSGVSKLPLSTADVIGLLEKQELGLRTLQMEVLCHVESGPMSSPNPSGDMHLDVWRLGSPHGKMRVDYDSEIWPIETGGYREEVRSMSYDGRLGYQLVHSSNRVGENLRKESGGTVFVERPSELDIASNDCAWTATVFGVFGARGERFSAVLRFARDRLTVRQDDHTVTLEFSSLQGDEFQVVLDCEHHWALR